MRRIHRALLLSCIVAPVVAIIVPMTAPDAPDDPLPPRATGLASAVTATRAVGSARVELATSVAGPSGPVAVVHRGAFADGGARARAASDMSQVAAALEAAGQQLDGDWSQPTGVMVDGDTVYSQLGPMAESLGRAPDDWARASLADVTAEGAVVDNDTLALALDPLGPLDLLRRPVTEVDLVGEDQVRDVATWHVRAGLVLTDGDGEAPPPGSFEARLAGAGVDILPVDVWVDDAGVVRRVRVRLDGSGSLTMTFEVFDVGDDIDVSAPDPADVIGP